MNLASIALLVLLASIICMNEASITEIPPEIIDAILAKLCYVHLKALYVTCKQLKMHSLKMIKKNYLIPEQNASLDLARIGSDFFSDKSTMNFARSLFKRQYPYDLVAIDILFSQPSQRLSKMELQKLEGYDLFLYLAFKHRPFTLPVKVSSQCLQVAGHKIVKRQILIKFYQYTMETFIGETPILDLELLRSLVPLSQDKLNPIFLRILETGSVCEGCVQAGDKADGAAVVLALRLGNIENISYVTEIMDSFQAIWGLTRNHFIAAVQHNPDKQFNLGILEYCRIHHARTVAPLSVLLASPKLDPCYYLALANIRVECFEPENLGRTIEAYKGNTYEAVRLIQCAIVARKEDQFVLDLIDSLELPQDKLLSSTFLLTAGISDKLAEGILSRHFFLGVISFHNCSSRGLVDHVARGLAGLSAKNIFGIFLNMKKYLRFTFEVFLQSFRLILPPFEKMTQVVDMAVHTGCLEEMNFLNSSRFVMIEDPLVKKLLSLLIYAAFKGKQEFHCAHPEAINRLKSLPNVYDKKMLEEYLKDAARFKSIFQWKENQGHILARHFLGNDSAPLF